MAGADARFEQSSMVMKDVEDHRRDTPSCLGWARPNKARWPNTATEDFRGSGAAGPGSGTCLPQTKLSVPTRLVSLKRDYKNKDGVISFGDGLLPGSAALS